MRRTRLVLALMLFTLVAGCFWGRTVERHYYLLDYIPEVSRARMARPPWPQDVLVRNFEVSEAYFRPELVYRKSAHEVGYYWNDLWAVRPEQVVTDMVRRHLQQIKLFKSVQNQYEENKATYELRGRVLSMEEYILQQERYAHLELRLEFLRLSDNAVLYGETFDVRRKVFGDQPVYVVRGLSGLLEACMDRAVASIDSVMALEPAAP